MQFFVQSNIVDKGVTAKELDYQRVDVIGGAVSANIIAWFIIVTTGTCSTRAHIPATSAEQAALALAPVAGQYATVLFAVGLFGASLLAAFVLPLTAAYAVTEAFGFERGIDRTWSEAPVVHRRLHLRHRVRRDPRADSQRSPNHHHGAVAGRERRAPAVPAHLHDDHRQRRRIMGATPTGGLQLRGVGPVTVVIGLTVALLGFMAAGVA